MQFNGSALAKSKGLTYRSIKRKDEGETGILIILQLNEICHCVSLNESHMSLPLHCGFIITSITTIKTMENN
jgi:hypothetical protein